MGLVGIIKNVDDIESANASSSWSKIEIKAVIKFAYDI